MSIEKATKSDLSDRLRNKLKVKFNQGVTSDKYALLLDISGSMRGEPIEKLRELASGFTDVRRFEFSYSCSELAFTESIGEASGGTAMHYAFEYVKSKGIEHVVLITDGEPDSEGLALKAADDLIVDILYVGPDPAPAFLRMLCKRTKGSYGTATLDDIKALSSRVRGLLPFGSGAINL